MTRLAMALMLGSVVAGAQTFKAPKPSDAKTIDWVWNPSGIVGGVTAVKFNPRDKDCEWFGFQESNDNKSCEIRIIFNVGADVSCTKAMDDKDGTWEVVCSYKKPAYAPKK